MKSVNQPYVLVLGASVVDIFGFSAANYRPYNSTPGCVKMSFGGVCRNIAENMARVGVNTKFISVIGNDESGRGMLEHSVNVGYDMSDSLILDGCGTPTYMAILDERGEMVSAVVDMKSIEKLDIDFIDTKASVIENSEYTFLDADNPENLEHILTRYQGRTKFILDPISAAKADSIKHLIGYFHTIKPNRFEAEVMSGITIETDEDLRRAGTYFRSKGVENVFISLDEEGIYYNCPEGSGRVKAQDVPVKNVTGAGDSFVAGIGYSYMNRLSVIDTIKFSMTMSMVTIAHEDTINPEMCNEKVLSMVNEIKWMEVSF